jgi:AcrR family transcriptional regulator
MRQKDLKMRTRQREKILQAAMRCFIEKGLHKASIQDISEASGLSPGQIYRIFEGKDAIIHALADEERQEAAELIDYINASQKDIAKGLCDAAPQLIAYMTDPSYALITLEFSAEAMHNEKFAALFSPAENEIRDSLIHAIKASQKCGAVKKSLDAETAAFLILSLFDGMTGRSVFETIQNKRKLVKTVQTLIRSLLCA